MQREAIMVQNRAKGSSNSENEAAVVQNAAVMVQISAKGSSNGAK